MEWIPFHFTNVERRAHHQIRHVVWTQLDHQVSAAIALRIHLHGVASNRISDFRDYHQKEASCSNPARTKENHFRTILDRIR